MDRAALKFAQEVGLRQIDECSNVQELQSLAKTLLKSHFESRSLIATLMLSQLQDQPSGSQSV